MQILSIHLEDFKSYDSTHIDFTLGTNAIVGHNGAGKSSILEAIGFALFDYQPSGVKQNDLVREGANNATITATVISSRDERAYDIIRRMGSSSKYEVFDPEQELKICERKEDVQDFLREHMGIDPTTNLSDFFANAVGVPQGTFTSAFLQTPANRRPIFDPLLRVEEYKKAVDNLREPMAHLRNSKQALDVTISGLTARLERLPALRQEQANLTEAIAKNSADLAEMQEALEKVSKERSGQEEQRQRIADLLAQVQQARTQLQNWQTQQQAAQKRLAEASEAAEIVAENEAGHKAYVAAQSEQKELAAQVKERQGLRDRRAKQAQSASVLETKLEGWQRSLAEAQGAQKELNELAPAAERQEALEKELQSARTQTEQLADLQSQIERQKKQTAQQEKELATIRKQVAEAEEVEKSLKESQAKLDALNGTLRKETEQLGGFKPEADRLKEQNEGLQKGDGSLCPVCEQPLDDDHRASLIQRNEETLVDLRQQWASVKESIKANEAEVAALQKAIKAGEARLRKLSRPAEAERAAQSLADGQKQLAQLGERAEGLGDPAEKIKTLSTSLADLGDPRSRRAAAARSAAKAEELTKQIERGESDLAQLQKGMDALDEELTAFADLDDELAQANEALATHQAADDRYRRHQQLAQQVDQRQRELDAATESLAQAQKTLTEREEAHQSEAAAFDQEAFTELAAREQTLRSQTGSLEGQLTQQKARQEALTQEAERLTAQQAELEAAQAQHEDLTAQEDTLGYLRSVLRDAGPHVTKALVEKISHQAGQLFGEIMQDFSRRLHWSEDYSIQLEVDGRDRQFSQLSGGEQMSAALAVRLALLQEMSDLNVAFFDEPTTNLDEERRSALARQIVNIQGFDQLFVISHDDAFEQSTENLIRIAKQNGVSVVDDSGF